MTNEKLIEEAAKAIQALDFPDHGIGWGESTEYGREYYRESARAALAVFEEAHTPTDDERERAERIVGRMLPKNATVPPDTASGIVRYLTEAGLLRRTEVPEPSADVVCICGSTRFRAEIEAANRDLTLSGAVVVAPGVFAHSGDAITEEQKIALDALHLRKIDIAARVLVVNPGKYIGESTAREIEYSHRTGKPVDYTHPPMGCEHEDMNCPTGACVELYPPYREDMGR